LRSGHAVLLASPAVDARSAIDRFKCDVVLRLFGGLNACDLSEYKQANLLLGYEVYESCVAPQQQQVWNDLCLLLSTSGSTGGARVARLSRNNVDVSASQVCHALNITCTDRAVTSLPLHHVYGLSVLHAQLHVGGTIVLTGRSVMDPRFWEMCRTDEVSILAGVPWTFAAMSQAGFDPSDLPKLRKATQSGEKPDASTLNWLLRNFTVYPRELYLMYGQTEASGRISVLPPALARQKPNSVGLAVHGGRLECEPDGEIIYHGPNVMLGYANDRNDLARPDDQAGAVHTGDLGFIDGDGCLYLTGRRTRFCKILGERIDLDDVQTQFQWLGQAVVIGDDSHLTVYIENALPERVQRWADRVADRLRIPHRSITVLPTKSLPRLETGKISLDTLAGKNSGEAGQSWRLGRAAEWDVNN